jgi:type IV pilus assembly protein PilM
MKNFSNLLSAFTSKKKNSDRVVGIDIGSSSIKVVEIEDRAGVLTLTTYGELQLGPYDDGKEVGQSVTLDPKKEQQALVDVLRESAVKARSAVFAMPLSSSFVTIMSLKADKDEDLGPRVRVEARKYIPVPIGEVTIDWAEVETSVATKAHTRDVLVAAIQNEALKRFNALMEFVNLGNPPTEIECFSTLRALFKDEEKDIAIIDIGAVSSKLYIARQGLLQRMHRARAGGALATKRIAGVLEVSFEEAEIAKRATDATSPKFRDIQRAHQSCYDRAFSEFRQVIDEYEQSINTSIANVYVCGGGAQFPGLHAQLKGILEREVTKANPFTKVAYPAFMEDTLVELGQSFTGALGAALRAFD